MFVLLEIAAAFLIGWLCGGIWWGVWLAVAWGLTNLFFILRRSRDQ